MLGHFKAFNTTTYFCIIVAWDVFRISVGQLELIDKGNLFATWVNLKLSVAPLLAQIWPSQDHWQYQPAGQPRIIDIAGLD